MGRHGGLENVHVLRGKEAFVSGLLSPHYERHRKWYKMRYQQSDLHTFIFKTMLSSKASRFKINQGNPTNDNFEHRILDH